MIDLTDTTGSVATEIESSRETMAAATPRAALLPEQAAPAGYVDKVERLPRTFAIERKRARAVNGKPRALGMSEEQLQCTVVQHLLRRGAKGMHFFHVPNGGLRHKAVAGKLKAMGAVPGEPDVICLYRGHAYGLELKLPGGTQSADQQHVERQWELAGMTYAVAHGLDYALDTLRSWGLLE